MLLISQKALVIASQDGDTYGSIFTSTYALVYLAPLLSLLRYLYAEICPYLSWLSS
jgi:hypothetical protein